MKKPSRSSNNNQLNSRLILEELEARQLYSGGVEGLIVTALTSPIATCIDSDSISEQTSTRQDEISTSTAT